MDSLGWEHGAAGGTDDDETDDEQGGARYDHAQYDCALEDYDLAALNLFVLLDSMRRENRTLRRRLLAHGRTCRPPMGGA